MACAMMKHDSVEMAVHSDMDVALSAALQRAIDIGPKQKASIISMISKEEWKKMDVRSENVTVREE